MSASDKKKLRKEQTAAAVTEKQRAEKKTQKKNIATTVTFIVAMVLVIAIFLATALDTPIQNLRIRTNTPLTVNGHKINGVEFNYFYVDAVASYASNFSSYGDYASMIMQMYGLNPSATLGSQVYNSETGETYADLFAQNALESAKWTYAMYDAALESGFSLTAEQQASLDSMEASMENIAELYGVSVNAYIQQTYGSLATMKTYMKYYEVTAIASLYANEYYSSLEFTSDQLREYEKDKYNNYTSYSYATFTVTVNDYLTGGELVTNEETGKSETVYSDSDKAAADKAALVDVNALIENDTIVDATSFDLAIGALEKGSTKSCTENQQVLYTSLSISDTDMKEWITADARTSGEMKYFPVTSTTNDVETTTGYTVVLFLGRNTNTIKSGNVRHLLVAFEGGTTDSTTGTTTYSDAEKKAALEKAEELLAEFNAGEKTEEAFTALLKAHTDDTDSEGNANNDGLYENITPASGYVTAFWQWAYAQHAIGDVEIIETEYGYHIMYYAGYGEQSYRDMLIESDLAANAYTEWETAIISAAEVKEAKSINVNEDFIIPTEFYSSSYSY